MTETKLRKVLNCLTDIDRDYVLSEIKKTETEKLSYRRTINTYFNTRLLLLDVPTSIREQLIPDGSDEEWCSRFKKYVVPNLTKAH